MHTCAYVHSLVCTKIQMYPVLSFKEWQIWITYDVDMIDLYFLDT